MTSQPDQPEDQSIRFSSTDQDLGLNQDITRRDFLNAVALGTGAALLRTPAPLGQAPAANPAWEGFGGVGDYARSHGNMWAMVDTAHALRDGKLGGPDAGRHATDTGERYDLIVVGGGISGLGAASFFQQLRGGKCLVLDNHPMIGGEAKRNEFLVDGVRQIGPQGSNGFGLSPEGWAREYWDYLGLPFGPKAFEYQAWAPGIEPLEMARENYFFQLWGDEFETHGFFFQQPDGKLKLVRNAFATGIGQTPWSEPLRKDFLKWRSNPKVYQGDGEKLARWLDGMTYQQLLVDQLHLDPAVARYADPILAAATGGLGCDVISAQCAAQIALPSTANGGAGRWAASHQLKDWADLASSFPGGNDGMMRHVLKKLVPDGITGQGFAGILNGPIRFEAFDRPNQPTRIRLGATVVRVTNLPNRSVEVVYAKGGRLYKTTAGGAVMANGAWSAQYVVADVPAAYREAFTDFVRAPMLVVNVALRRWRFMYDQGITAASYRDRIGFSCNLRQSMVVGGYRPELHPDKPIVLTFYISFSRPGTPLKQQAAAVRTELLATPYLAYERLIREQMVRLFGPGGFDPRKDVAGIILNRWGHAYVCPAPGFYFGRNGKPAAPDVLRQPVGRVTFANSDLHGHQNAMDATKEGKRAVEQLLG